LFFSASAIILSESLFDYPDRISRSKYQIFEKNEAIEEYNPVYACIESSLLRKSSKKNIWKSRKYYLNGTYLIKSREKITTEINNGSQ